MALSEQHLEDDIHPIDIVETLAAGNEWEFDRIGDDQIAMTVEGLWRAYAITLAWSENDQMLRLVCSFDLAPPPERLPALMECLNGANDRIWSGAFTWWEAQKLMVFRYGLILAGGQVAGTEQIDNMIAAAVSAAERFYPAFQLVAWSGQSPRDALAVAIAEAWGRA